MIVQNDPQYHTKLFKPAIKIATNVAQKVGLIVDNDNYYCFRCKRETFGLSKQIMKQAPSGKKFYFACKPIVWLCIKCQAAGKWPDTSGDVIHINEWVDNYKTKA